jgi:tRNA 5-methylaminomethyl-2-thiouridine biosynthesis bifunctional protein
LTLNPARLQWSPDGSLTSADFGDIYFQPGRGIEESRYVFLQRNRLEERFPAADVFRIAELGFGTGLNFLLTAALWRKTAPEGARLFYASVEKHPIEKKDLARIYAAWPELKPFTDEILRQYPPMVAGFHHLHFSGIHLMLLFGDVAEVLPELGGKFDAWYLDGFAPAKNPAMWEEKLFPLIAARTAPGGTLATFSSAGAVRRGLAGAGFDVEKVEGFGTKREMTVASLPSSPSCVGIRKAVRPSYESYDALSRYRIPTQGGDDVTVLGAGIAGCSAAYALAEKGWRVTVIDRQGAAAQETSGNPAGILYPKLTVDASPMGLFHQHGFCYTRALLEKMRLPSWKPCGVLRLDLDDEDAARTKALIEKNGWPEDFTRIAAGGLLHETAGYLSPPEFCRALLDHPNIKTVYSKSVDAFPEGPVVIALGNGSLKFPQTEWLPLQSLRGQVSYLAETPASRALKTVVCHNGFVTPAIDGVHVAGATFQKEAVGDLSPRAEDHDENLTKLKKNLPDFDAHEVTGGRAGYRATTPDKLPLIGACPDHAAFMQREEKYISNLYVSTGFGAHGLSGAPLAGEIVACLLSGDPLPVPGSLMPYLRPERFILRDLKRNKKGGS